MVRAKWTNLKKKVLQETEVVKQLDAERSSLKEMLAGRRKPSSHPIFAKKASTKKSSFVFQPLDENPASSGAPPVYDPDVWKSPDQDTSYTRSARAGPGGTRKVSQDAVYARGATTKGGATARVGKAVASSRLNSGIRGSTTGKKGTGSEKSNTGKDDAVVMFMIQCLWNFT